MTQEAKTLLRIDSIHLENFQCFKSTELFLHPSLTILVADNAKGKTSFLLGLAQALDAYISKAQDVSPSGINRNDVRRQFTEDHKLTPCLPAKFKATGVLNGASVEWGLQLNSIGKRGKSVRADSKAFCKLAKDFVVSSCEKDETLPIVAFYGTGRLHREHRITEKKKDIEGRVSAFNDCITSSSSYAVFTEWYASMVKQLADPKFRIANSGEDFRPELALAAVREAIRVVLEPTDWNEIDWPTDTDESSIDTGEKGYLVVENKNKGRFPLPYLSDGVRSMVTMVGDLAHRCARLNPHLSEKAAAETPGVVLIDEVDMHLHPRWQQKVIRLLQQAFPQIQFVLTTHSPHVVSTVNSESIRIIRHNGEEISAEKPTTQTRGVESADVLAKVMGVDPVPDTPESKMLSAYRALVESDRFNNELANVTWQELKNHFGNDNHLINELRVLKDLQVFRNSRPKED